MPYSVVMRVKLPQVAPEEDERMLREMVVPNAKAQPGFASGIWMRNSQSEEGLGVAVFDTEDHAKAAAEALKPPPGGPHLLSVDVYQVGAEA